MALRNGRRVVRAISQPSDRRGLTGVPRSTESASKYFFDWPIERSEYSKNGTSASSQPQARSPVSVSVRPSLDVVARPQTVTWRRSS